MNFTSVKKVSRRAVLRGVGVSMALPWLDAMSPAFARTASAPNPRRFVSVSWALGFHGPNLFPDEAGRGYKPSVYIEQINDLIPDLTVFSGVSHPGVQAGHLAEPCILSGAPLERGTVGSFRNTISLDQLMAKDLGGETRFPSIVASPTGTSSASYTENGAMIPPEQSEIELFRKLFIDDTPEERQRQANRLREGRSIMDIVHAEAKSLEGKLGAGDKQKLDNYFTSVRELEGRMAANEAWAMKPKPKVDAAPPREVADRADLPGRLRNMLGVFKLALETDSTRFLTLFGNGDGGSVLPIEGVTFGCHSLSHHGKDPEKIAQLTLVEKAMFAVWGDFIRSLKETDEAGKSLLDSTMVLLTSNLGNASSHDNKNMPVVLAGGGFKHGQHLAFDRKDNYPLTNLYVQMLQRVGLEYRTFATSTAESVPGFEMA